MGAEYADETSAGEDLLSTAAEPAAAKEGWISDPSWASSSAPSPRWRSRTSKARPRSSGDAGLADIFKEFKKGVDKQLGKEDYDTRYNLGIAYKEMGLIDEAIAEFQLAAKDEARLLECSSMLGHLLPREGHAQAGHEVVREGAQGAGPHGRGVRGPALRPGHARTRRPETSTRRSRLFTDLYGQDANFRDVAAKVRDLRAMVQG